MITRNLKVPTGNICVMQGEKGLLEFISVGDYGKEKNIKADFLGLYDEINGVPNGDIMSLEEKWVITISTQYGCSMNCKFCLLEDAPILMSDYTYKKIKDINIDDEIICNVNGEKSPIKNYASLTTTIGYVTGVIKRKYNGLMYKIKTKDGHEIICTEDHPISKQYKSRFLFDKAKNISIKDNILVSKHIKLENYNNSIWMIGWAFGFIYGDGTYDEINSKRWMISQNGEELLDILQKILVNNKIKYTNNWNNGENNYRFAILGENVDKLNDLMSIYENDIDYKRGFISGFWDAEGYSFKNNQCVRVCNTNKNLIELIIKYLNELGFKYTSVYESNNNRNKTLYVLNISINRDLFNAEFTPFHNKKYYLNNQKSKSFCYLDEVTDISVYQYSGFVYNFETSEHNYYAYDVLTHNCDVPKVGSGLNATYHDMLNQILYGLNLHSEIKSTKRLNIHYARMGEPTFNNNVLEHAKQLHKIVKPYIGNSMIHPVISTMLPKSNKHLIEYLNTWCDIKNNIYCGDAGLQFSINSTDNYQRNEMFSGNSLSLEDISEIGKNLPKPEGRKYTLNFALADNYIIDAYRLKKLFNPDKFMCKITPIHQTSSTEINNIKTTCGYGLYTPYKDAETNLKEAGFDVIVFVPSYDEDYGLITCGNAILSGSLPKTKYEVIK